MIVYLPFLAFALGALLAYGSAGRRRQLGTILIIVASAWSLALLAEPRATAWAVGPLLTTWWLRRPAERMRSNFETLTRRVVTIAAFVVLALVLASRLPFGENPLFLNAVPWLLGAVGAAWVLSPIDAAERLQGQVLMVSATGALLLAAVPAGIATAAAGGATAIIPLLGERARTPATLRPLLSSLMLLAAGLAALVAAVGLPLGRQNLLDIAINPSGQALLGAAIVLVAGALLAPVGIEWAALLGIVALMAGAPALRWSAVAALVAVATALERAGERPAWIALASLAAVPLIQALAPPAWTARVQAVALGVGLVILLYAGKEAIVRVFVLPASAVLVLMSVESLSPANLTRFQWIAASGVLVLITIAGVVRLRQSAGARIVLGDRLLAGLLLLAISARDALGLGALAMALMLVDLAIVRVDDMPGPTLGLAGRLLRLGRSNWPPSATFAGASLAVIAALQASLALGLLAAVMWAGLQLAPLLDHHLLASGPERPQSRVRWLGPALGLAVGIAPAVVLRMLRL
jgi:hypothetical protein